MTDTLAEIEEAHNRNEYIGWSRTDWLIVELKAARAEVERLRAENKRQRYELGMADGQLRDCVRAVRRLEEERGKR